MSKKTQSSRTPRRDANIHLHRLYQAAMAFADDRRHFAPGQYTMFEPREGATHYAEHLALIEAALAYGGHEPKALAAERERTKKARAAYQRMRASCNWLRNELARTREMFVLAMATNEKTVALLQRTVNATENLTQTIKDKL